MPRVVENCVDFRCHQFLSRCLHLHPINRLKQSTWWHFLSSILNNLAPSILYYLMHEFQLYPRRVHQITKLIVKLLLRLPVKFILLEHPNPTQLVEPNNTTLVKRDEHLASGA